MNFYEMVRARTLVDPNRMNVIANLAVRANKVPGDVAEVGVYKGGTGLVIAESFVRTTKKVFLCDTFEGIPYSSNQYDFHQAGEFGDVDMSDIERIFAPYQNVSLVKGIFPESGRDIMKDLKFCFVHIDVDVRQSTVECLEFFYPRMSPGGYMVFDDYKWRNCPGVTRAIDEFFSTRPEKIELRAEMQCMVQKQ